MSKDKSDPSRRPPSAIRQEVRQRCGFGCVICGMPLYEYEHMEEWAKVRRHVASEITLLCDSHHREKTNKLLPIEKVREADKNPYNLQIGRSNPFKLWYSGTVAEIVIGGNSFENDFTMYPTFSAIVIDGISLLDFSIQDGQLLLSAVVFDESGKCVLEIHENSLEYSVAAWDVEFTGTTLTIRQGFRKILFEIELSPPNKIQVTRGVICLGQVTVEVRKDAVVNLYNGSTISGMRGGNNGVGINYNGPIDRAVIYGLIENADKDYFKDLLLRHLYERDKLEADPQTEFAKDFEDEVVDLDDKQFVACRFKNTKLVFSGGLPRGMYYCHFEEGVSIDFNEAAENTVSFLRMLYNSFGVGGRNAATNILNMITEENK
ncbi:HNH endonuclease signature motif containing protein [Pseudomonas sp. DC3000-4b1]|uniref:HNH endonuclease signature motif containing protein n=1 Tax=unclassified Pseudomonas TaxID=196821 RepID=UPI003CFA1300